MIWDISVCNGCIDNMAGQLQYCPLRDNCLRYELFREHMAGNGPKEVWQIVADYKDNKCKFQIKNNKKMNRKFIPFIKSNDWFTEKCLSELECGAYNGYIAVSPESKLYGKSYDEVSEVIPVHGGFTYADYKVCHEKTFTTKREVKDEYVGKLSPIFEDAEFIIEGDNVDVIGDDWIIYGFDTMHCGDDSKTWNREAVVKETMNACKAFEGYEKKPCQQETSN